MNVLLRHSNIIAGPPCEKCAHTCVDARTHEYLCTRHGRRHICVGGADCVVRAIPPDGKLVCLRTGLLYGHYINEGRVHSNADDVFQSDMAAQERPIGKTKSDGRGFKIRGHLVVPMLRKMMEPAVREAASGAFWATQTSRLRADTRALCVGSVPAVPMHFPPIAATHLIAFADRISACYDRNNSRGNLSSLADLALYVRMICERVRGFDSDFVPPWAYWLAPRGMSFSTEPFWPKEPPAQSTAKRSRPS